MNQYIIFKSNNEKLAINISSIERIIEYKKPKKIPESSKYLLGVIKYSDKVIPLIDLTYKLYNVKKEEYINKKIIISRWEERLIALLIDEILGIETYDENQYEKNLEANYIIKDYIKGFIKCNNSMKDIIIVLDMDKIFTKEQSEELLLAYTKN